MGRLKGFFQKHRSTVAYIGGTQRKSHRDIRPHTPAAESDRTIRPRVRRRLARTRWNRGAYLLWGAIAAGSS